MTDNFHNNLLKILRWVKRVLKLPICFIHDLPGVFLDIQVNWFQRSIIFLDRFGFKFWQFPGDEVRLNWKRKAIGDSTGVNSFILKYVEQGFICIDIGAAQAGISVSMWSRVGLLGKVISVEPDPKKISRIKSNLKLNQFPENFVVNAAISDRVETRSLRCYPKSAGWNTLGYPQFAKNYDSFLIDVRCIDFRFLLQTNNIEHVNVVKIDTEGAELLILKGMRSCLMNKRVDCVIFEVNPLMLPGMNVTVKELFSFWEDLPYALYLLEKDGDISRFINDWPDEMIGDCVALVERD